MISLKIKGNFGLFLSLFFIALIQNSNDQGKTIQKMAYSFGQISTYSI
jgi:hypothetical protein